jgi:hypothetical protein
MCYQFHAPHLPSNLTRLIRATGQLYASALAAPARMNLGLHHNHPKTKFFGGAVSLFRRAGHQTTRHRHAKSSQ